MKNNWIHKVIAFGVTPLILSACLVAKKYETPELKYAQGEYRVSASGSDSTTMADIAWRDFFTDPILQNHIATALENNLDMRKAIQQIDIAQAYVKQGKAGFAPTIGAKMTAGNNQLSQNSQSGIYGVKSMNNFELSANLSWEADIWGKIRSQKRAADASFLSSVAAHQAIQTAIVSSLATIYYQLLSVDEQIKLTQETIEIREKSIQTIQALKDAGIVNAAAVQQTEAQIYSAQGIMVDLKNQRALLENAFSVLKGEQPHEIERSTFEAQVIETDMKTEVPALLLSNRPDVMMAESNYRRAFEMTNVARAAFYPSLTLSASGGLQSINIRNLFDLPSLFSSVIGGLVQPIFYQRQIRTQKEVATSNQEIARLDLEDALLNASKEVVDAQYNWQYANQKAEYQSKEAEAYEKAYEYSLELLNNGLANYLEVLTAQERALNVQLSLIQSKLTQLTSIVELYRALGGGTK